MRSLLFVLIFSCTYLNAKEAIRCGKTKYSIIGISSNTSSYKPIVKYSYEGKADISAEEELLKYFTSNLFGAKISGTSGIAEFEIIAINDSNITLKVLEEKYQQRMNGQKQNHFLKGNKLKLNVFDYQKRSSNKF